MATREARTRRAHFRRRTARAREATVAAATLRRSINRNRGLAAAPEGERLGERSAPGHWLYCLAPPSELTENARELAGGSNAANLQSLSSLSAQMRRQRVSSARADLRH